jgi:hypothetical protein
MYILKLNNLRIANRMPPKNPSIVFLGEIFQIIWFDLLIFQICKRSLVQIKINSPIMIFDYNHLFQMRFL